MKVNIIYGMDIKARVRNAVHNFEKKQLPGGESSAPKRKNKKPEAEAVKEIKTWLKNNGFAVNTVEAKATFDPGSGRYLTGQVERGFTDVLACDSNGYACYIEIKAKGKRHTLKDHQREFIIDKINHNAFAGVFDTAELLSSVYAIFVSRKLTGRSARAFLLNALPPEKKSRDDGKPLFD